MHNQPDIKIQGPARPILIEIWRHRQNTYTFLLNESKMKIQPLKMELPAAQYRILSPANPIRELKTYALVITGKTDLRCRTSGILPITAVWKEKNTRRTSVYTTCTDMINSSSSGKEKKDWVHFVGVGGCGLSALAMLALKQGYEVSGSDIVWSSYMDGLQEAGARLFIGHSAGNVQKHNGLSLPDAVVMSSAIPPDNVEILHAKSVGVPVYKRDYWLRKLTENYNLIAVSGSHGKSTTASMLAYVLSSMGEDLTAVVGAHVPQFVGGNIIFGRGQNFVLEADEYDGCFLRLSPNIVVVTNVDWEHVDIYQDEEAVKTIFRTFLKQIRAGGHLILCGDSLGVSGMSYPSYAGQYSMGAYSLLELNNQDSVSNMSYSFNARPSSELGSTSYKITTYGFSRFNEWQASAVCTNSHGGSDYKLCHRGRKVANISLQIPGMHNVLNSLAVIATVSALTGDYRQLYKSIKYVRFQLNNFKGVSRRFEMIGRIHECHIYDDYAHHPTEVRAVLQAARQRFPCKDIVVVFQPHTYSRVAALGREFATAFSDADEVIVTEIYAARETNVWNVSGRDLANSIISHRSEYVPTLVEVVNKLVLQISKDPDRELVILTLGAGDITTVGRALLHQLQQRAQSHDVAVCYSKVH